MIGTLTNHHPYGSATASEQLWDDALIDLCLEQMGYSSEYFDSLTALQQNLLLTKTANQLEENHG